MSQSVLEALEGSKSPNQLLSGCDCRRLAEEHFVLSSEPNLFTKMHLIPPISWSSDWGQAQSSESSPLHAQLKLIGDQCLKTFVLGITSSQNL